MRERKQMIKTETKADNLWTAIVDRGIATASELGVITNICGYTVKILNDVIYARTGYRDIEQLPDDEDVELYL